jgi:hypothetical protein
VRETPLRSEDPHNRLTFNENRVAPNEMSQFVIQLLRSRVCRLSQVDCILERFQLRVFNLGDRFDSRLRLRCC